MEAGELEKFAPEPKFKDASTSMSQERLSVMMKYNPTVSLTSLSRSKVSLLLHFFLSLSSQKLITEINDLRCLVSHDLSLIYFMKYFSLTLICVGVESFPCSRIFDVQIFTNRVLISQRRFIAEVQRLVGILKIVFNLLLGRLKLVYASSE